MARRPFAPSPHAAPAALALAALAALGTACSSGGTTGDKPYVTQPYDPPPGRGELGTGELILTCEQHLQAWQQAMAAQRTSQNREDLQGIELALKTITHREQARLEEQAVSGPPRNRAVASAALAFTADAKVLPLLMNNVADPDPLVRTNALLGVGVLGLAETPTRPIYDAARDPAATAGVRRNAAYAAFRVAQKTRSDADGSLTSTFGALLDNPDPSVRAQCAVGIGLVRATPMLPPITDLLAHDPDAQVRTGCAYALGEIGSPGSVAPLLEAMSDRDKLTAGTARASLVKLHGRDEGPDPDDWKRALGL